MKKHSSTSGSIFLVLFSALAVMGILGAGMNVFIKGPLSSAVKLTRTNGAQAQMALAAQSAVMAATGMAGSGDCDADSYIEPVEWRVDGTKPFPTGGGLIPLKIGVTRTTDPWGNDYGYCVWDHGPVNLNGSCQQGTPGTNRRLAGTPSRNYPVVAVISSGPDKTFTTTCRNFVTADVNANGVLGDTGDLELVSKASSGDDDQIFTYTYEEATSASGGLWSLKSSDANTAVINKAIEAPEAKFTGTSMMSSMGANAGAAADCTGLGAASYNDPVSGNCYFRTAANANWTTTKATCEASGGYLASITSSAENSLILANIFVGSNMFIGASDTAVEGQWVWAGGPEAGLQFWQGGNVANGGVAVGTTYNNWHTNAPSTTGSTDDFGILISSGLWSNVSQTSNFLGICEKSGASPVLSMEDGLRIADASVVTTCDATNTGVLRRTSSGANLQICDGTSWTTAGGSGIGTMIDNFTDGISNYVRNNIFLGKTAGTDTTTGGGNIVVGSDPYATITLTTGSGNTTFGKNTARNLISGSANTAMGAEAMQDAATASRTTAFGGYTCYALGNGTSNTDNTCIGGGALNKVTTKLTSIGMYSGYNSVGDIRAVWLGQSAGNLNTSGIDNTGIGHYTLDAVTAGGANTALGYGSLGANTAGSNTAVGGGSLGSNTSGANNTAVGQSALGSQTTTSNNTAIGYNAARQINVGLANQNLAAGYSALYASTGGANNTAIGSYAAASLTNNTSNQNVAVGRDAMRDKAANTANNIAVGATALKGTGATVDNIAIGWSALSVARSPSNVAIGYSASKLQTSATSTVINTAVGSGALAANAGAANNTAIGFGALNQSTVTTNSVAIGYESLFSMTGTTANSFTAVGYQALRANGSATLATAVGYQAMLNNISGINNTAVGYQALYTATTSPSNVAVGSQALYSVFSGSGTNTAIGAKVGYAQNLSSFIATTFIGTEAGYGAAGQTSSNAVAVGYRALYATGAATVANSTAFGSQALNAGGTNSSALGFRAANANTQSNVTAAGYLTAARSTSTSDTSAGALAAANSFGTTQTAVGYRALVNALAGADANKGAGAQALENLTTGDNNTAIGFRALASTTSGGNNTAIGSGAVTTAGITNSMAIGYGVTVSADNTIRLGNSSITAIEGQVAFTSPSDRRLKKDIAPSDLGLDFIMGLKPVSYRLKQGNGRLDYGFLAQDIEVSLDHRETNMLTRLNDQMKTYQLRSNDLVAPIVKAIQERQVKIDDLKRQIAELKADDVNCERDAP